MRAVINLLFHKGQMAVFEKHVVHALATLHRDKRHAWRSKPAQTRTHTRTHTRARARTRTRRSTRTRTRKQVLW